MAAYSFPLFSDNDGPTDAVCSGSLIPSKNDKPRLFNKKSEERLIEAVRKVAEYAEQDGMHPTQAIIKATSELKVPEPFVPLMVSAYNTGRAAVQRETCERGDELCKLADFPVAILEEALAVLHPDKVDTPAVVHQKTAISDEYFRPPQTEIRMGKVAAAATVPEHPKRPMTLLAKRGRAKWAMEDARREAHEAADAFDAALEKVAVYFVRKRADDRVSLPEAACIAERFFGKPATHILDYVRTFPGISETEKTAEARFPVQSIRMELRDEPHCFIAEAISAGENALQKYAILAEREAALGALQLTKPAGLLASAFGGAIGGGVADMMSGMKPKSPEELVRSQQLQLMDPEHLNQLRQIRAQAMLTDLLHNDEVLSGYDPEEVLSAYNELAEMSPRVSVQPAAVRSFLRKRMAGGNVEPFDLQLATGLEKDLKGIEGNGMAPTDILGRAPTKSPALG